MNSNGMQFKTEQESVAYLVSLIPKDHFKIYYEVPGFYHGLRQIDYSKNSLRIDLLLIPSVLSISKGCNIGGIGIECKRSEIGRTSSGTAISQSLDYHSTLFTTPHNVKVKLDYVFLWPMNTVLGLLASFMVQNRIGIIKRGNQYKPEDSLLFCQADGKRIIEIKTSGEVIFHSVNSGLKVGSR